MNRLEELPIFQGLDAAALESVARCLSRVTLPGGRTLFDQGSDADAMYVVLSGQLGAFRGSGKTMVRVGRIRQGETVGEMALLSGKPRSASVIALRDSVLLKMSQHNFLDLVSQHPQAALSLARTAVSRLENSYAQRKQQRIPRTIAILPQGGSLDVNTFVDALYDALSRYGSVACVREADEIARNAGALSALEQDHSCVLYVAGTAEDDWSARCLRQADAILYLVDSNTAPQSSPQSLGSEQDRLRLRIVVLRHRQTIRVGAAYTWRAHLHVSEHHHVRDDNDIQRLARTLCGRNIGLVLSGGGARGFAHLGVLRALHEAELNIDVLGGTSFGAIVAAGLASEWSDEEIYSRLKYCFVQENPLDDYTVPLVALTRGVKATELLRGEFGEQQIEDLPLPMFCVSANLTIGDIHEHRTGPVWQALRASIAIPGVLPPVFEKGQVLVDGGVINNLPADVMSRLSTGPIIGVDIAGEDAITSDIDGEALPNLLTMTTQWFRGQRRPSMLRILLRAGMVNAKATMRANQRKLALFIKPAVNHIDLLDWSAADRAIKAGYEHTQKQLEELDRSGGWLQD